MEPFKKTPPGPDFRALPKSLLHEHLDGGLRPQTLLELCAERGVAVPADDADALARWMHENADSGSLERYLQGFAITVAAMASPEACERVAFEAAEDARADGCVLAEFRLAPLLWEPHGLSGAAVVEAILAGLQRSSLRCGLIVCGMRTDNPADTTRSALLAATYQDQGVVGFDLAGAERYYPPGDHAESIRIARDAGISITCHAGESDEGSRVFEAAELGATRIGHGIQVTRGATPAQAKEWLDRARAMGLHFEVCPSSNVHTGNAESVAKHPIRQMVDAGLSVSCNTDNRLMSSVTVSGELEALHREAGFSLAELKAMVKAGVERSFLSESDRKDAMKEVERGWV